MLCIVWNIFISLKTSYKFQSLSHWNLPDCKFRRRRTASCSPNISLEIILKTPLCTILRYHRVLLNRPVNCKTDTVFYNHCKHRALVSIAIWTVYLPITGLFLLFFCQNSVSLVSWKIIGKNSATKRNSKGILSLIITWEIYVYMGSN